MWDSFAVEIIQYACSECVAMAAAIFIVWCKHLLHNYADRSPFKLRNGLCFSVCGHIDRTHSTQQQQTDRYSDIEILHTAEHSHMWVKCCSGRQIRSATIFVAFNYSKMEMEKTPSGDWASVGKYGQWRYPFNFSVGCGLNVETWNHSLTQWYQKCFLFIILIIYLMREELPSTPTSSLSSRLFVLYFRSSFRFHRLPRPTKSNQIQHETVNIRFMNEANTMPEPNVFYTPTLTFTQTRMPSEIRQR